MRQLRLTLTLNQGSHAVMMMLSRVKNNLLLMTRWQRRYYHDYGKFGPILAQRFRPTMQIQLHSSRYLFLPHRTSTASHDPRESFASSGSSYRDSISAVSPQTSVSPTSIFDGPKEFKSPTYPPTPPRDDTMSILSFSSTSSRKARPESLIIAPTSDPLVLGVALVDFNHLVSFVVQILIILSILDFQVGPRIEFSRAEIFEDAEILPFLALPDGAHLVRTPCNIP
jgi:hypothetical protein